MRVINRVSVFLFFGTKIIKNISGQQVFKSMNGLTFRDMITKISKTGNEYTQVIFV